MDKMFSVREVAAMFNICEDTIYRATWRGDLKPLRVGKQLRFTKTMLDSWIENNTATARKMPRKEEVSK